MLMLKENGVVVQTICEGSGSKIITKSLAKTIVEFTFTMFPADQERETT